MLIPYIQYPHGSIKWFLESSQGLLLRLPALNSLLLGGLIVVLLSQHKRIRPHGWVLWIALGVLMWSTPHYGTLGIVGCTALLGLRFIHFDALSEKWKGRLHSRWVQWLPSTWFLAPQIVRHCTPSLPLRFICTIGQVLFPLMLLFGWQWIDLLSHYEQVRKDMEQWPIERLDDSIKELAHSPPGVRADWHGVRIMGKTAIVTCEQRPRLMAFDLTSDTRSETPLHQRWGMENVGPLESEVNPKNSVVWTVNGGKHILESKLHNGQWKRYREVKLPSTLSFSYMTRSTDNLFMIEVQTGGNEGSRKLLTAPLPQLRPITEMNLTMNGSKAPMPREPLWVPTIQKLIYGSEFGNLLYAIDMKDGAVSPWLEADTFNGKMAGSDATRRVYSAVPNKMQIQVIDPMIPSIEHTLWTQPGVRALAVDEQRNLLVSASVLTGQIWVQDAESGTVLKRMGTVYPMVREIALAEELGIGVLTTWNAVYQFKYID